MKNTTKKISEITIESNVRRIKRDSSGQRYNEYLTFNIGYNPTIKNFSIRLFAKFIDIVLFSIVAIVLYIVLHRRFEDFYEWFDNGQFGYYGDSSVVYCSTDDIYYVWIV